MTGSTYFSKASTYLSKTYLSNNMSVVPARGPWRKPDPTKQDWKIIDSKVPKWEGILLEEIMHQLVWHDIPLFTRCFTSQVVQDFWTINSVLVTSQDGNSSVSCWTNCRFCFSPWWDYVIKYEMGWLCHSTNPFWVIFKIGEIVKLPIYVRWPEGMS